MSLPRHSVFHQRCVARAAWRRGAVVVVAVAGVLLAGCAAPPILPAQATAQEFAQALALPRRALVTEVADGKSAQESVLVAQREAGDVLRWSLFDALGLPLARQMLHDRTWRNDGLLPPNARARTLFAALLFAWTPQAGLASAYASQSWSESSSADGHRTRVLRRHGQAYWTITWQRATASSDFTIEAADGARWLVRPLEETP